jgi:hypothetical protein
MPKLAHYFRYLLLLLGIITLLSAMWGGLMRLGLTMFHLEPQLSTYHGPLMISGFLGTVISLERAVGLGSRWAYIAPTSTAIGALILIVGLPAISGALLMTLGSLTLFIIFISIIRIQTSLYTVIMGLSTLLWLIGNCLWITGSPIRMVVFLWMGFLVLMIAGERLEITRIIQFSSRVKATFVVAVGIYILGLLVRAFLPETGVHLLGLGMIAVMMWLMRYDIAWRSLRISGLPRFMAACLISGYVWLGISGAIIAVTNGATSGLIYDAALHALFLGFVFSMIFAHAPVIFSAILNLPVTYKSRFYIHLALLDLTLVIRILGDLNGWADVREAGGFLNVLVILLFLASTGSSIYSSTGRTHSIP